MVKRMSLLWTQAAVEFPTEPDGACLKALERRYLETTACLTKSNQSGPVRARGAAFRVAGGA